MVAMLMQLQGDPAQGVDQLVDDRANGDDEDRAQPAARLPRDVFHGAAPVNRLESA